MPKVYDCKFRMVVEDDLDLHPQEMLEQENEDGKQVGYSITNIEIKEVTDVGS